MARSDLLFATVNVRLVAALGVLGGLVGCAQVLGIKDWSDPPGTGGAGGAGGTGGAGTTTEGTGGGGPGSCADRVKNGAETDVDCGGDACPPCAIGKVCLNAGDCQSGTCTMGKCAPAPPPTCEPTDAGATCNDCMKDGDETDIDCGGTVCLGCGPGKKCNWDADCLSSICQGGMCAPGAAGTPCHAASDCASGTCDVGGMCLTPKCCR